MTTLKEPIAIIGFDAVFPGEGSTPESFYDMLLAGRSARGEVPANRYNIDAFYHPDYSRAGTVRTRHGHFIQQDIATFDAPFFAMTPTQAAALDPQQRCLMESTYRAAENAGITISKLSGSSTSVFVGNFARDYSFVVPKDPEADFKYMSVGMDESMLSARLSWFYNLKGLAYWTEFHGESLIKHIYWSPTHKAKSIVAGANLIFAPEPAQHLNGMRFLSPDGKSYSFDEAANGYARGEGFGVLVLKRVSDAFRDGDVIRAVIRNTVCNQDGRSPSITQPMVDAQEELIRKAYDDVGLDLADTRFFEAHATGTAVGDPTEMEAIAKVFAEYRSPEDPMYIGAVKSNIGHLEGAAGIASLVKSIMTLERGYIPANAWFKKLNPKIDDHEGRFAFPTTAVQWPSTNIRRISVNGFGFGGTNAHVILDDARSYLNNIHVQAAHNVSPQSVTPRLRRYISGYAGSVSWRRLFIFSAPDEQGLRRVLQAHCDYLQSCREQGVIEAGLLADFSHTLAQKRSLFSWRSVLLSNNVDQLLASLSAPPQGTKAAMDPRITLVFTGQGSQWARMGKELLIHPAFRDSLFASGQILQSLKCSWDIIEESLRSEAESRIHDPMLSQPLTSALQIALVDLLYSLSIVPDAVIGHSSGEIAAAYAAGAISHSSALRIAYLRGALSSKLANDPSRPKAGMLAVSLGRRDAESYIASATLGESSSRLSVACINSPSSVTISGAIDALDELEAAFKESQVFCRRLKVKNGFHSQYMGPMAEEYRLLIGNVSSGNIRPIRFFSSLTGDEIDKALLAQAKYWVDNLMSPVLFSQGLGALSRHFASDGGSPLTTIEIGPHAALSGPIRDIVQSSTMKSYWYESLLRRGSSASDTFLQAIANLLSAGVKMNLAPLDQPIDIGRPARTLLNLPSYPFDHEKRYWHESRTSKSYRFRQFPRHDLLGAPSSDWNSKNAVWMNYIRVRELPWLKDFRSEHDIIYPTVGVLSMGIEACKQLVASVNQGYRLRFSDVKFLVPIIVPDNSEGLESRFNMRQLDAGSFEFEFWSCKEDWVCHARGQARIEDYEVKVDSPMNGDDAQGAGIQSEALSLQNSKKVFDGQAETLRSACSVDAMIPASDTARMMPLGYEYPHSIHPVTLHKCLKAATLLAQDGSSSESAVVSANEIDELVFHPAASPESLRLSTQIETVYPGRLQCSLLAKDTTTDRPIFQGHGIAIMYSGSSSDEIHKPPNVATTKWMADPRFISRTNFPDNVDGSEISLPTTDASLAMDLELLRFIYVHRFIKRGEAKRIDGAKDHYKKYIDWMIRVTSLYDAGNLATAHSKWQDVLTSEAEISELERRVEAANPEGRLTVKIGAALSSILEGGTDPLEILFTDKLVEKAYREQPGAEYCLEVLGRYVKLLAHKNPNIKILELGAGTGAATASVVQKVAPVISEGVAVPLFSSYDFTDLSNAFLREARQEYGRIDSHMRYGILDIEHDPAGQGYDQGTYDVVIAANVVHATRQLSVTLKNARSLLKPGGKLILHELTSPNTIGAGLIFGLLEGWWLHEEEDRKWSPLLTVKDWDRYLKRNGFSGVDLAFNDFDDPIKHQHSLMVSTAISEQEVNGVANASAVIMQMGDVASSSTMAANLQRAFEECSYGSVIGDASDITTMDGHNDVCIYLASPSYSDLSPKEMDLLSRLAKAFKKVIIVLPNLKEVAGQTELVLDRGDNIVALLVNHDSVPTTTAKTIVQMFEDLLHQESVSAQDKVYRETNGLLEVPRLVHSKEENAQIHANSLSSAPQVCTLHQSDRAALVLRKPSPQAERCCFVEDLNAESPLYANEVQLRIEAAVLTLQDARALEGEFIRPKQGFRVAGTVIRAGTSAPYKIGDRICGLSFGDFGTVTRTGTDSLMAVPRDMSSTAAAYRSLGLAAAHTALSVYGHMQQGDQVLINGGENGFIQCCVRLALKAGVKACVNVAFKGQAQALRRIASLSDDHITVNNLERLTAAGPGKKFDLVVNSTTHQTAVQALQYVAARGRLVQLYSGSLDANVSTAYLKATKSNINISYVNTNSILPDLTQQERRVLADTMCNEANESTTDIMPVKYSMSEVDTALDALQEQYNPALVVVQREIEETIHAIMKPKSTFTLDREAVYAVSGSCDETSYAAVKWIIDRGATQINILSSSKDDNQLWLKRIDYLSSIGAEVTLIASEDTRTVSHGGITANSLRLASSLKGIVSCTSNDEKDNNIGIGRTLEVEANKVHLKDQSPTTDFAIHLISYDSIDGAYQAICNAASFVDRRKAAPAQHQVEVHMTCDRTARFSPSQQQNLFCILDSVCRRRAEDAASQEKVLVLSDEDMQELRKQQDTTGRLSSPLHSHLRQARPAVPSTGAALDSSADKDYPSMLREASTKEKAAEIAKEALTSKIATTLRLESEMDISRPLHEYGVDSLVAVELKAWLESDLRTRIGTHEIAGGVTVGALAETVVARSSLVK
nr:polyketide synthase 4 [Elsinoe perseae]